MKNIKFWALLVALMMVLSLATACGGGDEPADAPPRNPPRSMWMNPSRSLPRSPRTLALT